MNYSDFKKKVLEDADHQCAICGSNDGLTVHHLLKRSTFPQYRTDPDNGVCLCGICHAKIESMMRERQDIYDFYPRKLEKIKEKSGVDWKKLGVYK